jgi:U3 small nucleolar ribonucleoprotein protein IMP4
MRSLCHDLERVIPNAIRINRGKLSFSELIGKVLDVEADRLIIVERWKGGPGRMQFYQVSSEVTRLPPLLILGGVKTQIDFGRRRRLSKNIAVTVIDDPPTNILDLAKFLSQFLKVPLSIMERSEEKVTTAIQISSIPDGGARIQVNAPPSGTEVGPRLIVKKAVWETSR